MWGKNKLKIYIIAIIVAISGLFIYKEAIAPKLYDKYMDEGIKHLIEEMYEEAILSFGKAIKIEKKSTEARVYQAKAYVGSEEFDEAIEVLEKAQEIDITNEELLKDILEILNDIDSDLAYDFLDRYIEEVGKDSISQEIQYILDTANEYPTDPIVDLEPGTYGQAISVKLKSDRIKLGHSYYYTLDGTSPNKRSQKYRGRIKIEKDTTIKLVGYNKKEESTNVITLEYRIDKTLIKQLEAIILEGENLLSNTEVGTEIGTILKKDKNKLQLVLDKSKDLIKNQLNYEEINNLREELQEAIEEFKNSIIKPTDKSELEKVIKEAQELYNNSTEGTKDGQYKSESKATLLKSINNAKKTIENKVAKQSEIDGEVKSLRDAINIFKSGMIRSNLEEKILGKYIILQNDSIGVGIQKFEYNYIDGGYIESEGWRSNIISRREERDTIYYKVWESEYGTGDTIYSEIKIKLLNDNYIQFNGFGTYKLLTAQQLISEIYKVNGPQVASYECLKYFGISKSDVEKFYRNLNN